jgi:hypothetical protein
MPILFPCNLSLVAEGLVAAASQPSGSLPSVAPRSVWPLHVPGQQLSGRADRLVLPIDVYGFISNGAFSLLFVLMKNQQMAAMT